jgi:hypothetical protein
LLSIRLYNLIFRFGVVSFKIQIVPTENLCMESGVLMVLFNKQIASNIYQHHHHHHHHQPINVPTAGVQAFLMDYPQGERALTNQAGPVWIGGC